MCRAVSRRVPLLSLLALLLAGCDARPLVVGDGPSPDSLAGGELPGELRCPDAARARADQEECWPTRHVGRWRGFVTGDARYLQGSIELELPSGEVMLEIEPQGTGTLSFATEPASYGCAGGASGTDAGDAGLAALVEGAEEEDSGPGAPQAPACSTFDAGVSGSAGPGLALGHRYTLEALSMSGGPGGDRRRDPRVTFSLLIAEPWRDECNGDRAPLTTGAVRCSCNEDGCSVPADTLEVSLSLSRDGQAMRGTIVSPDDVEPGAGLELIRP